MRPVESIDDALLILRDFAFKHREDHPLVGEAVDFVLRPSQKSEQPNHPLKNWHIETRLTADTSKPGSRWERHESTDEVTARIQFYACWAAGLHVQLRSHAPGDAFLETVVESGDPALVKHEPSAASPPTTHDYRPTRECCEVCGRSANDPVHDLAESLLREFKERPTPALAVTKVHLKITQLAPADRSTGLAPHRIRALNPKTAALESELASATPLPPDGAADACYRLARERGFEPVSHSLDVLLQ